jgi:hypothetical protein
MKAAIKAMGQDNAEIEYLCKIKAARHSSSELTLKG